MKILTESVKIGCQDMNAQRIRFVSIAGCTSYNLADFRNCQNRIYENLIGRLNNGLLQDNYPDGGWRRENLGSRENQIRREVLSGQHFNYIQGQSTPQPRMLEDHEVQVRHSTMSVKIQD